ncbi:alpha/beta hydrolase [Mumia sp. zg.B53]|uniref:alpha/beta fold hydrolase n=1 Tax=unclassified Mumia TaxID=2621872 RepID=UPI001C6F38F4|nr:MULTISPECIES: alpha/beta hydrolase [unclassified Mumia]MBW9206693.1 alpha/beta hydrolase [Mumia sp. zg.B17]MBW9215584.1 alpha/beta hydrolase [Mumia sp. zg.B53]
MNALSLYPESAAFGSVSQAPDLPDGFTTTFKSQLVEANGIRQHAVIGGAGPALLLVHGWPENWYAWRHVMSALAQHYTVVAVDQRGIGLTDKPADGYDSATLASDLAALMVQLGHDRFAVVGHDTGLVISYALAADYPDRVERVALAEVPGPPTPDHSPPLFTPRHLNNKLWHIAFNRAGEIAEQLVEGREAIFFGYEFTIQGGQVPDAAIDYYVQSLSVPGALTGSFGFYRSWDETMAQNGERGARKLTMPVLGIGGESSWGGAVGGALSAIAENVETLVVPGTGHWVAEAAPQALIAALTEFLAPFGALAESRVAG